ncbi:hypothetical protein A0H81_04475 [Grifola frondosa]|uniref:Cytochrome b561 domain-containing protein n=1 Tax=Grifola frondosa TaxID=5627 RepID=A0A1C7MGB2_GRIFR|nr:hypothetical protein A0H81_04475 [Grifola frondosa]
MPSLLSTTSEDPAHPDIEYEPLAVNPTDQIASPDMGHEESLVKAEGRGGDTFASLAAVVSLGIFVVSTWTIILSRGLSSLGWFFWHPLLQSSSIALFTYGIMTLQPTSHPKTKAAGLVRHQLAMFFLGVPAITLGTLAMVFNKYLHGAEHFTTWHGTFGILSVTWMVMQVALGGGSVWFDGRLLGGNPKAKMIWKYHRLSGYLLFPTFLFTAHLGGGWSTWMSENSPYVVRLLAYTVSPIVLFTAILVRVRTSKMRFL